MIHGAIKESQIVDYPLRKIRQQPYTRVAEFFISKMERKYSFLNDTINQTLCVIGKTSKRKFLCIGNSAIMGRVSLGFPVSQSQDQLYIYHIKVRVERVRRFLTSHSRIFTSVAIEFSVFSSQPKPISLLLSFSYTWFFEPH